MATRRDSQDSADEPLWYPQMRVLSRKARTFSELNHPSFWFQGVAG